MKAIKEKRESIRKSHERRWKPPEELSAVAPPGLLASESILLIIGVMVMFYYKLCPAVYYWDSAELTVAAHTLGLPHSPGFPLYILLGKLVTLVTRFNPAAGMNLFSAITGTLTIFMLYQLAINLAGKIQNHFRINIDGWQNPLFLIIFAAAGCYSSLNQALRAEVYYPNLLLISTILYLAIRSGDSRLNFRRYPFLIAFLAGLGAGLHHLTVFLTIPAILIMLIPLYKGDRLKKQIPCWIGAFILGASVVMYIPLRYAAGSGYFWGAPEGLSGTLAILFSSDFGIPSGTFSILHLYDAISFAVGLLYKQLGIIGLAGAITGFIWLYRYTTRIAAGIAVLIGANCLSIIFFESYFYEYQDLHGYLLPSVGVMFVLSAIGWIRILHISRAKLSLSRKIGSLPYSLAFSITVFFLLMLSTSNLTFSLRGYDRAERLMEAMSLSLKKDSVVLCSSVNSKFLLDYKINTDENFDGVKVVDIGLLDKRWYREKLSGILQLESSAGADRYELLNRIIEKYKKRLIVEFSPALLGLAPALTTDGIMYSFNGGGQQQFSSPQLRLFPHYKNDSHSMRFYAEWLINRGIYFHANGKEAEAERCFNELINIDPNSADMIKEYKTIIDNEFQQETRHELN
ncbi:MAG: DUF2723 domain-containing protein [candidate division Zixibacteria bacterium]|nr:DUF2723 domain-containing protein [candidate division Zixibacteria bacterium]